METPNNNEALHRPIFVKEILEILQISAEGTYLDGTLGDGGHTLEILKQGPKRLISIDRDLKTIELFKNREGQAPNHEIRGVKLSDFANEQTVDSLDGILVDLGVSTRQLLTAERGFSFREEGPLDMRMGEGPTLLEILKEISEEDLANAIYENAEERQSRKIAKRIKEKLKTGELNTTHDLAGIFPPKNPYEKTHPATQTFLALRMMVNNELFEISESFPKLIEALKPQGRMVVLTFHSVEDRLVKKLFKVAAGRCVCDEKICRCSKEKKVKWIEKITSPSEEEIRMNPRARSTKLRAIEKL